MLLRNASEPDILEVRGLPIEAWHDTYDAIYGARRVTAITNDWHSVGSLKRRLASSQSTFLIAEDGGQVIGMAFASMNLAEAAILLHQLYVRPNAQGKGIGTALLDEIRNRFAGTSRMKLEVEELNRKAVRFYRPHGFVDVGLTATDDDANVRVMARALRQ